MMRSAGRFLLFTLPIVLVVGVLALAWQLRERATTVYTDADTIRRSGDDARPRDILWQDALALPDSVNTDQNEYEPRLSADGMTLYFVRGKPGENADLYSCRRTPRGWTEPEPVFALNSESDELGPEPLADGNTIIFYSDRDGGLGGYDLWMARRADEGWETPVNLGPAVNSRFNEYGPAVSPDDATLYFSSNRPQSNDEVKPDPEAWPATVREELHQRNYDLYASPLTERGAGPAEAVAAINSPYNDGAPAVSPAGDFLYFSSDRPGGHGRFDLYRARRLRGEHTQPENLGVAVNSEANELDPALDMGGFSLHFSSDRDRANLAGVESADYDLYHTMSREVFTETETWRASIDWVALLPYVVWVILLLLAFVLLWLLSRFLGSVTFGRLSLIAKCVLVSAIAHMLILFLLAFWGVGASVSDWAQDGRGTRVALVSPSVGQDSAAQIRGNLTELEVTPTVESQERTRLAPATLAAVALAALPVDRVTPSIATIEMNTSVEDAPPPDAATPDANDDAPDAGPATVMDIPAAAPAESAAEARREAPTTELDAATRKSETVMRTTPAPPAPARLDPVAVDPAATLPRSSLASTRDVAGLNHQTPSPQPPAVVPTTDVTVDATQLDPTLPAAPLMSAEIREPTQAIPDAPMHVTAPAPRRVPVERSVAPPPVALAPAPSVTIPSELGINLAPARPAASVPSPGPSSNREPPPALDAPSLLALDVPLVPGQAPSEPTEVTMAVRGSLLPDAVRDAAPLLMQVDTPTLRDETALPRAAVESRRLLDAEALVTASTTRALDLPAERPPVTPTPALATETSFQLPEATAVPTRNAVDDPASSPPLNLTRSERASIRDLGAPRDERPVPSPLESAAPLMPPTPEPPTLLFEPDRATVNQTPMTLAAVARLDPAPLPEPDLDFHDLTLPAESVAPPNPQPQREAERRQEIVQEMGGSVETEEAVARALNWLMRHQSPDGRWDGDDYDDDCGGCAGDARVDVDIALTGLSLLCFFAADHTHTRDGPYRDTVRKGVEWLVRQQRRHGHLLGRESMYSAGIATIALAEAYGMTGDRELEPLLVDAVEFIVDARNRRTGGWRYAPGQAGDTSVLGWQIMALSSAKHAGIDVPPEGFDSGSQWLDRARSRRRNGLYTYQPSRSPTPAMTAEGLFIRQLLGSTADEPEAEASVAYVLEHPPQWHRDRSTYYLYYATLALFQHGGDAWKQWNEQLKDVIVGHQVTAGPSAGSWEPVDQWALTGGRIYQTAICTLTLEVYYRYLPRYMQASE